MHPNGYGVIDPEETHSLDDARARKVTRIGTAWDGAMKGSRASFNAG